VKTSAGTLSRHMRSGPGGSSCSRIRNIRTVEGAIDDGKLDTSGCAIMLSLAIVPDLPLFFDNTAVRQRSAAPDRFNTVRLAPHDYMARAGKASPGLVSSCSFMLSCSHVEGVSRDPFFYKCGARRTTLYISVASSRAHKQSQES